MSVPDQKKKKKQKTALQIFIYEILKKWRVSSGLFPTKQTKLLGNKTNGIC